MKVSEQRVRSLTPQDARDIVGDLDDAKIAAVLATGANAEQLEEAMAWASGESDVMGEPGASPRRRGGPAVRHPDDRRGVARRSGLGGGRGSRSQSRSPQGSEPMAEPARRSDTMDVRISPVGLDGILGLPRPAKAEGIVLFAHGSGSGRLSPRNNYVAAALRSAGLVTLLFDLLTDKEAADRRNVFDIELLAERLALATAWIRQQEATKRLPIGYFGASSGAAAARLQGRESAPSSRVAAVPDMAGAVLGQVRAPTLLIVGGAGCRRTGPEPSRPLPSCSARKASRSCPARRICSKSPAPSIR